MLFCFCIFSHFSIAIISLGEERANLSAFRTFVRFALVWFCLFPLPLGVWEGLLLVIVALPRLFSYLFAFLKRDSRRKVCSCAESIFCHVVITFSQVTRTAIVKLRNLIRTSTV